MSFLRLSPDVGFCSIRGELVFLDLARDRYFRLAGETADAVREAMVAGDHVLPAGHRERLTATGLFAVSTTPCTVAPATASRPERSLLEEGQLPRISWRLLPELLLALQRTKSALRRGSLRSLVKIHSRGLSARSAPLRKAEKLALDFAATRRMIPVQLHCLLDSLTLAHLFRSRGIAADLVFGVKLEPFGAHCWLQLEDVVLNDSVGNVADFTPIMVA